MRITTILILGLASVAAFVPWMARGESYSDSRYRTRHKAADILQQVLKAHTSAELDHSQLLARYGNAVSDVVEMLGEDSSAADRLTEALRRAEDATPPSTAALKLLRAQCESVCKDLAFAPLMEAEMPQGFPPPTPVGEIEVKRYPAYRKAETESQRGSGFWSLFQHIKRNEIAMTAPVEMSYRPGGDGAPSEHGMSFLYGDPTLGQTGADGAVRIVDVPPQTVVSVGVRGEQSRGKLETARTRLGAWIAANSQAYRSIGELRVMGYNSPFVTADRSYFEVQIPVEVTTHSAKTHSRGAQGSEVDFDLSKFRWKNRVVIAFAPTADVPEYAAFRRAWDAQEDDVKDRDLILLTVPEQGDKYVGDARLSARQASRLRRKFQLESGRVTFILIGKDGTVKLRQSELQLPTLFDVIDAMPMRQAEMARQSEH